MRSGSTSGRCVEERERAGDVLAPSPSRSCSRALALAAPAGVVERGRRSRARRASARGRPSPCGRCRRRARRAPRRRCATGGTSPRARSPSEALKATSLVGRARRRRRPARATCGCSTIAMPIGPSTNTSASRPPPSATRERPSAARRASPSPRWRHGIASGQADEHARPRAAASTPVTSPPRRPVPRDVDHVHARRWPARARRTTNASAARQPGPQATGTRRSPPRARGDARPRRAARAGRGRGPGRGATNASSSACARRSGRATREHAATSRRHRRASAPVEEADHAPLVLRRARLDAADVPGLRDLPERLRLAPPARA